MEQWFEDGNKASIWSKCEKRTDGVKCPDCGTDVVWIEDVDDAKKMVCGAYGHTFWFVRNGASCARCKCEWTDSSKAQRQLRKSDEAATVTVVCLYGCTVRKSN